jgi:hypothetical protein
VQPVVFCISPRKVRDCEGKIARSPQRPLPNPRKPCSARLVISRPGFLKKRFPNAGPLTTNPCRIGTSNAGANIGGRSIRKNAHMASAGREKLRTGLQPLIYANKHESDRTADDAERLRRRRKLSPRNTRINANRKGKNSCSISRTLH